MLLLLVKYIKKNYFFAAVGVYLMLATALYFLQVADIFPPCLYKTITGKNCMSCGVTRGTLALLQCKFREAWLHNPLVYVYVPLAAVYFSSDFYRFYKNEKK